MDRHQRWLTISVKTAPKRSDRYNRMYEITQHMYYFLMYIPQSLGLDRNIANCSW